MNDYALSDSAKYRKYAEECRRLAKLMRPEHRETLIEIAEAWLRCAKVAERGVHGAEKDDDASGQDEQPLPTGSDSEIGKRNQAAQPPPDLEAAQISSATEPSIALNH